MFASNFKGVAVVALCLLGSLLTAVNAQDDRYLIAFQYMLADPTSDCTGEQNNKLNRVTKRAMEKAGMELHHSDDSHWQAFETRPTGELAELNITVDVDEVTYNQIYEKSIAARRLQWYDAAYCRYWCYSYGTLCHCCNCGGSRRMLRSLQSIRLKPGQDAGVLARRAEKVAVSFLNRWRRHLSCLKQDPFTVTVIIKSQAELAEIAATEDFNALMAAKEEEVLEEAKEVMSGAAAVPGKVSEEVMAEDSVEHP